MKAISIPLVLLACVFTLGNTHAGKPTKGADGPYIGNGFPSGPHFNLNIHGKADNFTCPDAKYVWTIDSETVPIDDGIDVGDDIVASACPDGYTCTQGDQIFGNVINVPRDASDVKIYVESGRKGPKTNQSATVLEVTDWCASVGGDTSPASFRIPEDQDGYAVYARVTGKPVDGQYFEVFGRELAVVEVECSAEDLANDPNCEGDATYDLLLLGLVDDTGSWINYGNGDGNFDRIDTNDGRGGKGVKNATDITGMFEFSGQVCYFYEGDPACTDTVEGCSTESYCCPTDADGYYLGACLPDDDLAFVEEGVWDCSNNDGYDGLGAEALGTIWLEETFYCHTYTDAWIFNIADFVDVLFDVRNNNTYNIQLRFYPLPLQEGKVK